MYETMVGVTRPDPTVPINISAFGIDQEAPAEQMDFPLAWNSMVIGALHLTVTEIKVDVQTKTATVTSLPFTYEGHADAVAIATIQRVGSNTNEGTVAYKVVGSDKATLFDFAPVFVHAVAADGHTLTNMGIGIRIAPPLPGMTGPVL